MAGRGHNIKKSLGIGKFFTIVLFLFITYLLCNYYTPLYIFGDQLHYNFYYESIKGVNFAEGYFIYNNSLGAREPVFFILTYIASNFGIDKIAFFTVINLIFAFFLVRLLLKVKVNIIIIFGFLFNYYFFVLLFAAERLKVALMILLISFFVSRKIVKYLLYSFTFFSHFQSLLLLYILLIGELKSILRGIKSYATKFLVFSSLSLLVLGVLFVAREALLSKFMAYAGEEEVLNLLKPMVFVIFSLFVSKEKNKSIILTFLPLIIASFLLGEERIVIFCYFLFISYAIRSNNTSHPLIFITSFYFIVKGLEFLENIELFGNGFV